MLGLERHQQSHVTLPGRPHKAFLCVVLKVIWFPLPGKEYSLACLVFFTRGCGLAHVALVGFLLFFTNGCRIVTCPPRLSWQTGTSFLCSPGSLLVCTLLRRPPLFLTLPVSFINSLSVSCLSFLSLGPARATAVKKESLKHGCRLSAGGTRL